MFSQNWTGVQKMVSECMLHTGVNLDSQEKKLAQ
jgi:hypothetical protein